MRSAKAAPALFGLALALGASGCGLANLVDLPGDLLRSHRERPVALSSAGPDAGPVERALHGAARGTGQPGLLVDTPDPADDLKRRARACDTGDGAACAALGGLFVYVLGEADLGLSLWERACEAGVNDACGDAADLHARPDGRWRDEARAQLLARRACRIHSRRPHACALAASWTRTPGEWLENVPPDVRYLLLDRGCELHDPDSCAGAAALVETRQDTFGRLAAYYARGGPRGEPGPGESLAREAAAERGVPPTPGGDGAADSLAESKRALLRALRGELAAAEASELTRIARSGEAAAAFAAACTDPRDRDLEECTQAALLHHVGVPGEFVSPDDLDPATVDCILACRTREAALAKAPHACSCGCLERASAPVARAIGRRCGESLAFFTRSGRKGERARPHPQGGR